MSTQIGTATDYVDLLTKLDAFLCTTGHAWGKRYTGVGTGDLTAYLGTATSVAETFTITATGATTFTVVGSVSGALANATVGTPYTSAKIAFTITAGGTAFQAGDVFTINTAPPWRRLLRNGWADPRSVTTDLLDPNNLIDGSVGTLATSAATTSYIEWTMAAPTRVRRIYAQAPSSTQNRMPTTWVLRWKDNPGDPWTTAQTFTKSPAWTASEGIFFVTSADPGEHLYWRLEMSGATTSTAIAEITLHPQASDPALGAANLTGFRCAWEAPGLDGVREIITMAQTEWVQSADTWNLAFGMSRAWASADVPLTAQPGFSSFRRVLLGTTPVGYWFIVNGQRAIVVTSFQGLMQVAYIGFGFPYEPPSVHAYPAIAGATTGILNLRFSNTEAAPRFPIDPGNDGSVSGHSLTAYFPDSAWRGFVNRSNSNSTADGQSLASNATNPGNVWPAKQGSAFIDNMVANLDGSRSLIPCVLFTPASTGVPSHVWGEFDGLYWTTGAGTAPQAIVRYENFDHLVVNNVFRTSARHFGAVRLD